jgi:hypothetical protein
MTVDEPCHPPPPYGLQQHTNPLPLNSPLPVASPSHRPSHPTPHFAPLHAPSLIILLSASNKLPPSPPHALSLIILLLSSQTASARLLFTPHISSSFSPLRNRHPPSPPHPSGLAQHPQLHPFPPKGSGSPSDLHLNHVGWPAQRHTSLHNLSLWGSKGRLKPPCKCQFKTPLLAVSLTIPR